MGFDARLGLSLSILVLSAFGVEAGAQPAFRSVCELPSHQRAAPDFGEFCGFLLESSVKPDGTDVMKCLRERLSRCEPAFALSAFAFPDPVNEAVHAPV